MPKSFSTYFLICVFGIGSWIAINGLWAEMSVLVVATPECEKLPALLVVIIQIANVGPLLFGITKYCFHRKLRCYEAYLESGSAIMLILIGIISSILLSLFWNKSSLLFNGIYSVALIFLTFTLALVDCTSSVIFIPFMKRFPSVYLSALYIGEGLSGLLPSMVALSQGPVRNNISCSGNYSGHETLGIRFSPNVYFLSLAIMMMFSGIAFVSLITLPHVHKQMVYSNAGKLIQSHGSNNPITSLKEHEHCPENNTNDHDDVNQEESLLKNESEDLMQKCNDRNFIKKARENIINVKPFIEHSFTFATVYKSLWSNAVLYTCIGIISFLTNGTLSAISSFAFLPYGNNIYHIGINLALLASPLMSIIFLLLPSKSKILSVVMTAIACILGTYILSLAISSPDPFLKNHFSGKFLIVSLL